MSRRPAQRSDLTSPHQPEQEHEMYDQTPITNVMTIGVSVTDQDKALEFYLGTLRLEKRRDVGELLRWPGVPTMFAFRDQDGNRLEIIEVG